MQPTDVGRWVMALSSLGGCITCTSIRLHLNVGHKRMGGCPGYRMEKRKPGQGRKLRKSLNASLMIGIMGWMSDQSDQYERLLLTLILGTWTSNTINAHYFMPHECSRTVASCAKQCFPHFTVSRTTGSKCIFWIHCSHAVLKISRYSCKKKKSSIILEIDILDPFSDLWCYGERWSLWLLILCTEITFKKAGNVILSWF